MSRRDAGDSREELPFVKLEDVFNAQPDLISCNEILEKFLELKVSEQHLTVSNIEDGSYLLKMNIGPFPPLTCLIAENDWVVMMQKVVATVQSSIGTTLETNSHPSPKYTAEKAMSVREKGLSAGHSPSTSFERVLRTLDRRPSREELKMAERIASILKDVEELQLEIDEEERLEVMEEEKDDWNPEEEHDDVDRQVVEDGTITFSGGAQVSEERMPDKVDRSPAVSPSSISSMKPAKNEDASQLSPSTSCGRRFSAAKSPPKPAPVTDVQGCCRKNTRSLKVRFHRVGDDRYKVIGFGDSTILSESQADNQNTYKSSYKCGRKKAKKSKHESSGSVGNNDEMAYMIDESTVAESHSDVGSPQLLNGSGSTDSLSDGDNWSHSFSMDAMCSITKNLERSEEAADDTVVWSANLKVLTAENGESDSSPVPSQSRVMHHTWKRKHRRGDPVKVSSYVKRQSSPVSATILVHNYDRREKPAAGKEESVSNGESRRWRGLSVPPVLRTQEIMAKRETESAPPAIIKAEPLDPNFHPSMSSCIELKSQHTRSDADELNESLLSIKLRMSDGLYDIKGNQSAAAECGDNGARNVKVVMKKELEESLDRLPSSVSRTQETTIAAARRAPNRPKKIRPRAGRRTGERVTADDQISSDDFTTGRISDPAGGSNASEADPGAIEETEKSPQPQDGPSRRREGKRRLKKHLVKDDESLVVSIRRWSSVDAYFGDNDEEGRDGLVIAEEDQQNVVLSSEKPLGGNISDAVTSYGAGDRAAPISSDRVCENEGADALVEEEQEEEAEYEDEEEQGELEHEVSDERSESEVSRLSLQSSGSRPVEGSLEYRFQLWSEAYKKFRTNPYFNSEGDVGKAPQFVRYPPRSTSEVHVVIKSGKAYALLRGRFEVAIKLPVKGPNPTNWKEILVGDVVWVRWRKNEHWPATVYEITDTVPVKVTVFWVNDKTQSTVDYWQVDLFDMAFHLRFDSRRSDPKYVRAVVTALRYMGKMGFWETFLTRRIYEELVKEEGPSFCQHISAEDIKRIKSKKARPLKISKEKKKEDQDKQLEEIHDEENLEIEEDGFNGEWNVVDEEEDQNVDQPAGSKTNTFSGVRPFQRREHVSALENMILLQKSEELLQALQASHFIFSYEDPPLVGSAYPLTNQVLEDYLGSACCASRNSEPLFEDGSKPYFETSQKYDIDPEVMGSNEIYHPDNGVAQPVEVINAVTIGYDSLEAEDVEVFENSYSSPNERVTEYISVATEEEKPPTMEPFSEIDALRRDHPYRLPPKKRHRFKSCSSAKAPKVRRQN